MKGRRGKGNVADNVSQNLDSCSDLTFQNQDSCSNDTNLSTNSSTSQRLKNPIALNESKIRNILKELQTHVKNCQREREKNAPNLNNINKTHEKLSTEDKITPFYRKKLKSMYTNCIKESQNEIRVLRQALDCINQIRLTQNEIRLMQHNKNQILNKNLNGNASDFLPKAGMRRGVLMSILQQAALTLPLWIGEIGQLAPPLCGSVPPESSYICKQGDKVAAKVRSTANLPKKSSNKNEGNIKKKIKDIEETLEDEEENWILAEVVSFNSSTGKYEVDDVDCEDGNEKYVLVKKRIVPLPHWRANPLTDPNAIFPKESFVLALYPQTTCFYRGIVSESPQTPQDDYLILFEDNTYPDGYSPPLNVPQLYVVVDREIKK
ncbi:SAGA-associated factor 29 [Brachionus plicatilis]|uniref:SAGA-associated factor 29 n=1 Tax=Brachionus plicatilis TaxID=10195 RepID=A0A3M7S327_BRAPC|nr:SAGA-associated factor 29 [Brachionus plicatilis]